MPTPKELRERANEAIAKAKALEEKAESEERDLTEEESAEFDSLLAQADESTKEADDLQARIDERTERRRRIRTIETSLSGRDEIGAPVATPAQRVAIAANSRLGMELGGDIRRTSVPAEARDHEVEARGGFVDFGEMAIAVQNACVKGGAYDDRLFPLAAASGMQQKVGSEGGFLVPPAFSTELFAGVMQAANSLLAMTDQYTVTGESLTFPRNAETSRANGSRWGGVRGYWIAEADQITSSSPKVDQMKLEPQEMAVLIYATNKLLRNATALTQFITRAARDEINFVVGDAIINGTGAGQPLGILNSGALITIAKESGQAADSVVARNISKMWARCPQTVRSRSVWLINQDVETSLPYMAFDEAATSKVPVYMPANGISGQPFATLYTRPIVPVEYCSTIGDAGDVILADMMSYATGIQGGVEEATSPHIRFDYAETAFRFMFAVDGQPWLHTPITPFKGTNTQSPFLTIAARA